MTVDGATTEISFVIVNWRADEITRGCIESARRAATGRRAEIIVVDNESSGAKFDADVLVENKVNRGFAGGANDGIRRASGRLVAVVNNDCELAADWLAVGAEVLSDSAVGIVGGADLYWDEAHVLGDRDAPRRTYVTMDPRLGFSMLHGVDSASRCRVASVNGSNILAHRSLLDELGGFDESFFTYYEDADLCARTLALGFDVVYSPQMVVWHRSGLSSSRRPFKREYLSRRNHLLFVARHFPVKRWWHVVLLNSLDYFVAGMIGTSAGIRGRSREGRSLGRSQRLASVAAGLWGSVSWRALAASRKRVLAAGQHDERYADRLASFVPNALVGER